MIIKDSNVRSEYKISHGLSLEEIEQFKERLVNRTDVWFKQYPGGYIAQSSRNKDFEPMSSTLIQKVLAGVISCSLPAFNADGLCKWAAWDWDHETPILDTIERGLRDQLLFNPLREGRRQGRSGHCWLFFSHPIPASELLLFDEWLREVLGIRETGLEFFPRRYRPGKVGTPLRMPLSRNLKPEVNGARGWFDGVEQDVATQVRWFLKQPTTDSSLLRDIVADLRETQPAVSVRESRRAFPIYERLNIWDYVKETNCKTVGRELATQCPVCALEGHDKHCDNLRIQSNGAFICMFGSPGRTHHITQVIDAFLAR